MLKGSLTDANGAYVMKKTLTAFKRRTVQRSDLSEGVVDEELDELLSRFEPFMLQAGVLRKQINGYVGLLEKAHMETMQISLTLRDTGANLGLDTASRRSSSERETERSISSFSATTKPLCGLGGALEPLLNVFRKELVQLNAQCASSVRLAFSGTFFITKVLNPTHSLGHPQAEEHKAMQQHIVKHKYLQLEFDHYVQKLKGLSNDKVVSNTQKLTAARVAYELHKESMAHRLRRLLGSAPEQHAVLLGSIFMCDSVAATRTYTACGDIAMEPPMWLNMAANADAKLAHLLKAHLRLRLDQASVRAPRGR
eukprot:2771152-Pyramimonas_sp.AAC.1